MSLADSINKLKEATASNSQNNEESAFSKLAHQQILRSSKRNPRLMVRILPPAQGKDLFFTEFRQWGVEYTKRDGSKTFTALNLKSEFDENDPLDVFINQLRSANMLPQGTFGSIYPKKHFYMNVVPYTFANGQLQMQTDAQGLPDVYVMDLGKKQMESVNSLLSEPINNPNTNPNYIASMNYQPTEEQKEWSFISSGLAYVIDINRTNNNNNISYSVNVQQGFCLPPLPAGWETKLEDLDALAEPSSATSASWVNSVINQMKEARGMLGGAPVAPVQAPTQAGVWNQATAQTTTFPPVQPQAQNGYVAQPTMPQPPVQTSTTTFPPVQPQVAPVQQAPVAPVQPTPVAPVQSNPLSNFGAPLNAQTTTTTTTAPIPPVQPTPVAPTPQAPVAPAQGTPVAPVAETPNDVLAGMGINIDL